MLLPIQTKIPIAITNLFFYCQIVAKPRRSARAAADSDDVNSATQFDRCYPLTVDRDTTIDCNYLRRAKNLLSAPASVKTASAMEPTATMNPPAKARVSSEGVGPGDATVIKTAECTGVRPGLAVWRREPVLRTGESSRS